MLIEDILATTTVAKPQGPGDWRFEEEPQVTLLAELGNTLFTLDRVIRLELQGELAVVTGQRESYHLPASRLCGLKVAGAPAGAAKRTGFV